MKRAFTACVMVLWLATACSNGAPPSGGDNGGGPVIDTAPSTIDIAQIIQDAITQANSVNANAADAPSISPPGSGGGATFSDWLGGVVDDVDSFWASAFAQGNVPYEHVSWAAVTRSDATVLTSNCTDADTGQLSTMTADTGPFYCPLGGEVPNYGNVSTGVAYFNIPYFQNTISRVQPSNYDFAVVSIVAHEIGHHVQSQLLQEGLTQRLSQTWAELGADCLSGVFANHAYFTGRLQDTDVQEAVGALNQVGNDLPYVFTLDPHGDTQQRVSAFMTGYNDGSAVECLSTVWPEGF